MSKVTIYNIGQRAHCHIYGCNNDASVAIGDPRFDIDSIHLCKEHSAKVYKELETQFKDVSDDVEDYMSKREDYRDVLIYLFGKMSGFKIIKGDIVEAAKRLGQEIDEEEETRVEILEGLIKYLKKGEVNHG